MSLRRKSCDACFKGRRKCDRDFPACSTCQRTKKNCRYPYSLIHQAHPPDDSILAGNEISAGTRRLTSSGSLLTLREDNGNQTSGPAAAPEVAFLEFGGDEFGSLPRHVWPGLDAASRHHGNTTRRHRSPAMTLSSCTPLTLPALSIPNFIGGLGEVQRVEGSTDSWQWAINELKRCPHDFGTRGETLFLHRELYRDGMPPAIRAALGVSATFCLLNENNRQVLFRVVDAEVMELLKLSPPLDASAGGGDGSKGNENSRGMTLIDDLARLQAFTLYQMMRMFGGRLEHRAIVDLQRGLITTWALQLLRRSRAELGGDRHASDDWHTWIVAESIRRTVMVIYMFYGMYSIAMHGFCVEFPTLAKLPVGTSPESWQSETAHLCRCRNGNTERTLPYEAYTEAWTVSPPKTLYSFDKFLIVPCRGFEGIAAYGCLDP